MLPAEGELLRVRTWSELPREAPRVIDGLDASEAAGAWHWEATLDERRVVSLLQRNPAGLAFDRVEVQYDDAGQVAGYRRTDQFGQLTNEVRFQAQADGSRQRTYRSGSGRRMDEGCHAQVWTYEGEGDLLRTCLDDGGQLIRFSTGAAGHRSQFDEQGIEIVLERVDQQGQPMTGHGGWHKLVRALDERGCTLEKRFLGAHGEAVINEGVSAALLVYERDRWCNPVSEASFGGDGLPVGDSQGTHSLIYTYGGGLLQKLRYFDVAGRANATVGENGTERRYVYDARGFLTEEKTFAADGTAAADRRGIHRQAYMRDEHGLMKGKALFDIENKPVEDVDGVHRWRWAYDDDGNQIEEATYDDSGRPTLGYGGIYRIRRIFGPGGLQTEKFYLDAEGEPMKGFAAAAYGYRTERDEQGYAMASVYLDADGEPMLGSSGHSRREYERDGMGRLVLRRLLHDGQPAAMSNTHITGHSVTRFSHNDGGDIGECSFFDEEEAPTDARLYVAILGGLDAKAHRIEFAYDANGRLVEQHLYLKGAATPNQLLSCASQPCADNRCLALNDRR